MKNKCRLVYTGKEHRLIPWRNLCGISHGKTTFSFCFFFELFWGLIPGLHTCSSNIVLSHISCPFLLLTDYWYWCVLTMELEQICVIATCQFKKRTFTLHSNVWHDHLVWEITPEATLPHGPPQAFVIAPAHMDSGMWTQKLPWAGAVNVSSRGWVLREPSGFSLVWWLVWLFKFCLLVGEQCRHAVKQSKMKKKETFKHIG